MRKSIIVIFCLVAVLGGFQQCKPDPVIVSDPNDPDSLYVGTPVTLERPNRFPPIQIPADNPLTEEGILLGRMLFYDPVISIDSSLSCASCHKQQFAFADGGVAFNTNINGLARRNTPPIFNTLWIEDFFWDGRTQDLPATSEDAMNGELHYIPSTVVPKLQAKPEYVRLFKKAFGRPGEVNTENIKKAMSQFMMTLISADAKIDKVFRGEAQFTLSEDRGFTLFLTDTPAKGADCFHCHASAGAPYLTMTDNRFHNNALQVSAGFNDFADKGQGDFTGNMFDNGKFRTPHLRNIELTAPYMHNARFGTLEQVINFYNDSLQFSPTVDPNMKAVHQGGLRYLTQQNKEDLIAFFKTLTDTAFINNPKHSNPFE